MEQQNQKQIDIQQSNKVLIVSLIVIAVLVTALLTNGFGLLGKSTGNVISESTSLQIGSSPVMGNSSAQVTIYEFSDFSCPYCAAADGENPLAMSYLKQSEPGWQAPLPNIVKDYVQTGKVKIVFKYFPGHGQGKVAQIVALALADQNSSLFWKFHDLAFANQADTGDIVKMKALAKLLGADMQTLEKSISSGIYEQRLQDDINMAKANGIQGTPTFVINGQTLVGARSYSKFKSIIDSELK